MATSRKSSHPSTSGFTIIEVMIVLVIAAVILLVLFTAVPQMQRNYRNQRRKQFVGLILADLGQYRNDVSDLYPKDTDPIAMCNLIKQYASAYAGPIDTCSSGFVGGAPERSCIFATGSRGFTVCLQSQRFGSHTYRGPYDEFTIQAGHWCVRDGRKIDPDDVDTNAVVTSEEHSRPPDYTIISVRTTLEDNIDYCLDNESVAY